MSKFKRLIPPHAIAIFLVVSLLLALDTGHYIVVALCGVGLIVGMTAMGCKILKL